MRRTLSGITAGVMGAGVMALLPITSSTAAPDAAPTPPPDSGFQKVTLNDRPGEPMDLAVLPNSDVLHTTREGTIWLNKADTGVNKIAGKINVYRHDEEGLQSIALEPGFDGKKNNWVYVYYSPPLDTPVDDPATSDVNEGDAPETGTPADFAPFKGADPALPVPFRRWPGAELDRAEDPRRPRRPRHLLPRRRRHRLRPGRQPDPLHR